MWQIFYDQEEDKWRVSEYSRSGLYVGAKSFYFRSEAQRSVAHRNGLAPSSVAFWTEGEGDEYE